MNIRSMLAPAAALLAITAAMPGHAAQTCFYDTCTIDLSTVTVTYNQYSSYWSTQGDQWSSYVYTSLMPALTEIDSAGRAGFTFNPELMVELMGGYGASGAGDGSFGLTGLVFTAKAGYKIDSIEFGVSGSRTASGDASATVNVPGAPVFSGDNFDSMALKPATTTEFGAGFMISADYAEGPDGTALAFGSARASIDGVRLIANVSAVPEPETLALLLTGLPLIAMARRRRA